MLVAVRRAAPLVPARDQAPFARLLETTLKRRRAPVAEALAPVFSKRQLRRLLHELSVDPQTPIAQVSVEQWAAITTAMVALVDPARWPNARPSWSRTPSAGPHRAGKRSAQSRGGGRGSRQRRRRS